VPTHLGTKGDDLLVEPARGLRRGRAHLALERVRVLHLAAHPVAIGDPLGRREHGHEQLGLVRQEPSLVAVAHVHHVVNEADGLQATGDHHGHPVHENALGGDGDRREAGRAEPVDRHGRARDGQARPKRGVASDIVPLGALRERAADDHVLDLGEIHASAHDRMPDRMASERRAVRAVQTPANRLTDARSGGGNDHGIRHPSSLTSLLPRLMAG